MSYRLTKGEHVVAFGGLASRNADLLSVLGLFWAHGLLLFRVYASIQQGLQCSVFWEYRLVFRVIVSKDTAWHLSQAQIFEAPLWETRPLSVIRSMPASDGA